MILKQLTKDKMWIDESGQQIPVNRTTKAERLKENYAFKILSEAESISAKLLSFKEMMMDLVEKVVEEARKENNVKLEGKGNYTWYNFNRSIKIEVNVNEMIKFDEIGIESAKEKLMDLQCVDLGSISILNTYQLLRQTF